MAAPHSYRICRGATVSLVAAALAFLCGSCAPSSQEPHAQYCALMPDTVGLYVGNPVTQMGVRIGKVTAITPDARSVRVDFTLNERRLPDDVKAVLRSPSILADRSLELVGNYEAGPQLPARQCIPLRRSFTPKGLSEIIGASTDFINSINPPGSTNIGDVVIGIDRALGHQGPGVNELLTTASALLDSPDQAIGDVSSIITNLAQLTSTFREIEPTLRGVLEDAAQVGPDVANTVWGGSKTFEGLVPIISMAADIETQLGGELQQTLDTVSTVVRKLTPRAPRYAAIMNPIPRYINGLINIANNHQFGTLRYRPPLYRIRTPDGVATCNIMNASMPGSCANVQGTPYAVDVALLQFVLTQAGR